MAVKAINLIYMVAIDHATSIVQNSSYAQYSIASWKKYCGIHDIDFKIIRDNDDRFSRPVWHKELIYQHGIGYEKIGIVDSDTMVIDYNDNIFHRYTDEFCGVPDMIDAEWQRQSIDVYQSEFFQDFNMDVFKYINAGIIFFTEEHLYIFKQLFDFYIEHKDVLDNWTKGGGREQTLLNWHIQKNNTNVKLLDASWNTMGIHTRNLLSGNWQMQDPTSHLLKYSRFTHFTGFPPEHRETLMHQTSQFQK